MIKRKYMRTRQLKPGMKLDHPVVDRLGRNLVARGAELDDYMIDSLLKLGIMSVYIQEGEEEENPEQVPTSPEAEKNIERLRTEDRAKVTLSASIRERVSTGIQFIYNNTTSEEMVATTESIADDLMRSIKSNDAIAIDISTLKTSDEYTFKHSVDVATISHDRCQAAGTLSRRSTGNRCLWFAARHWKNQNSKCYLKQTEQT